MNDRPRKTVLVVDDEEYLTGIWQEILKMIDTDCVTADSGDSAISVLKDRDVDLIITDLRMRGSDGFVLLRYLKNEAPKKVELVPAELTKYLSESKWEFVGLTLNSKHYKLPMKLAEVYEMELFLDKRTSVINKIIYHYKPSKENGNPTRVEIIYDQTILDPGFSKDSFSHTQFMRKSGGKWMPSMNYSGYSVFGDNSK